MVQRRGAEQDAGQDAGQRGQMQALVWLLRAWLPLLELKARPEPGQPRGEAAGEQARAAQVYRELRAAALMALGVLEDALGEERTVAPRRERREGRQRESGHRGRAPES